MSVFRSRPALRWLVPSAAAVLVIGGGAAAGTLVANADPSLPERSAAQLLVDVQTAKVAGLSGTVVQHADLGLPAMPGLSGGAATGGTDIMKLITGNNTARVWYAGEDKARVALVTPLGETDVIRNGADVWLWQNRDKSAAHYTLAAGDGNHAEAPATALPSTPKDAADAALAAIDPTTAVSTTGAAEVAGRPAYELVLKPRDTASLIGQVRLAIDAKEHLPLRVEVYAKDANAPAMRVAFDQISFSTPDPQQFVFNPPPGTKVTEHNKTDRSSGIAKPGQVKPGQVKPGQVRPGAPKSGAVESDSSRTVIGKGWTSVLVAKVSTGGAAGTTADQGDNQLKAVLGALPKVSGTWGSGRLLSSALFSALLTDDGRLLVGAVAPEKLYELAKK